MGVSEEHEALRTQVRRFVEREVIPYAEAWERDGQMPRSVIRRMGELGMLGLRFSSQYGGADADTIASVVFAEELGRSTFGGFAITILTQTDTASPPLAAVGTPEQKERFLPAIVRGDCVVAIAMTEPDVGSDIGALQMRAARDGESWVLDGAKTFVTNGVNADLYVVAARTDSSVKPSQGVSLFLVEKGTQGLRVERRLEKMGWRSSDTAQLSFDACRVPASALLGERNRGFAALMKNVQNERLVLAAQAIGESQAAIALTLNYVRLRKAFGATLWDKQAIRQRLAMLAARVESARYFLYGVAGLDARGVNCVKEVSMIKALCGELANEVVDDCVQFHGGSGYMNGTPIERMYRDARVHAIGGGATEVMLEEVAKRM
ncbi:acyl-CoA dehydrogenase [Pollutimonas nitritireducens]|uniref:Acyl-CoA dehydrogenase n=1 Tax=Pollutimonas nitritireducens TaxID=2045209 RepID=A0A2N4UG26_9BURK|nr:acyl-CoA dehydrogenase family protein [Pollutimonas nitritireducens]PLC53966.1 acyl-CoA dehydrogenase [Pollutimonas nitritireducens]